jgi:hypothetical protein
MELNGFWPVLGGGMLGPVLVELIKLAAWQNKTKIAEKYSHPGYWIATFALLLVSGTVAVINGTDHVPLIKAVQLGVNAPAIVAGYASASTARRRRQQQSVALVAGAAAEPQKKSFAARTADLLSW